jgi:hypothetical protein
MSAKSLCLYRIEVDPILIFPVLFFHVYLQERSQALSVSSNVPGRRSTGSLCFRAQFLFISIKFVLFVLTESSYSDSIIILTKTHL